MNDMQDRLSAILIEYQQSHSEKALKDMMKLLDKVEDPQQLKAFGDFFLSSMS